MRTACLVLVILAAACKEKQEAKPAPSPTPAPEVKKEAPPPAEVAKPAEPTKPLIKPAGGINTAAEYETKAFDLLDQLTNVFATSGTNCDKLAANIELFLDKNQGALTATDQFGDANPSAEDDLETKMQGKSQQFMQTAGISIKACQNHAGVKAAMAKLPD
jgi:hypothetical protein